MNFNEFNNIYFKPVGKSNSDQNSMLFSRLSPIVYLEPIDGSLVE